MRSRRATRRAGDTARFETSATSYRNDVQRSIAFSGTEMEYFSRRKAEQLVDVTRRLAGDPARLSLLDVGCGIGTTHAFLDGQFGALRAVDPAPQALSIAATNNPHALYAGGHGDALPFPSETFDVAVAICVVHHVTPSARHDFVAEVARVVRPGGLVALFEHNPLNPLTRLAVSRCPLDDGVILLGRRIVLRLLVDAGLVPVEARYIVFAPIDRPAWRRVEQALRAVPFGAQHYVVGRKEANRAAVAPVESVRSR